MLQTYIKVAIRGLKRKKSFAVINATGLSVAFSCCLVLFFHSFQELRYDHEWKGNDQVFRVAKLRVNAQEGRWQAHSQVPMGPALERDFSEVEASIRFWRSGAELGYNNQYFAEDGFYFTDPKVFEVFGFGLKQGDPASALAAPGSLVISEASAVKYFGDDDPIGKVIEYEGYPAGQTQLTVTGIFYDLPNNSSFQFDFLASLNGMERERNNWGSHKPIWTYLKLKSGADKAHLEAALPKYFDSFSPESFTKTEAVLLQPISEIYTGHTIEGGFKAPHNSFFSYMFMAVGILIFLIATVNFINLSVARLIGRSGEIGIRKVLGAGKSALVAQLLVESIIVVLISALLAIILIELSLPFLEGLLGAPFSISIANPLAWLGLAGAATVFIALSSIYPSWLVLNLKTTSALKSKLSESKGAILKQSLVVFQFATSLLLVFATLVGYLQMAYVQQKDLGFEKDQLLVVPYTPNDEVFMAQALQLTAVQGVSVSQRVPVNNYNYDSRTLKREGSELPITIESFIVDENFMEVFGMEVLAGEEVPLALKGDTTTAIVNEALVKQLGFETNQAAIGQKVLWSGEVPLTIRTVIKNYHTASLHEAIAPTLLLGRPQENWWKSFITVRLRTSDLSSSSAEIESLWRRHTPKGVYQSFFIEDSLAEMHMEDKRMSRLAAVFSGVAIVLSCLGLIGLCSYLLINRRKEFGIRKVLGAGLASITGLVSYTYLKLIAIGAVIALPVGWYAMQKWLDTFAYRITLRPSFLFLTVLAVGGMAFITVFLLSYKAVRENPVKAIREE